MVLGSSEQGCRATDTQMSIRAPVQIRGYPGIQLCSIDVSQSWDLSQVVSYH